MMSKGKRFFVKVYSNNEPFFFDEKQEYVEERYTCEDGLLETLNNQQTLINAFHEFIHLKGLEKEFDVFCNDVVVFKECGIDE